MEKGMEKGRVEEKQEIARNMKMLGVTSEIITKATGLTSEEIELL